MDHYTRLQQAVDFIEANLANSISLTDVSKAAFSSLSYLHRVFYFVTGFTVKEYIRKRRLSKAAYQLYCTHLTITDIALNSGYQTLESFIRAFKKHFGASPREYRQYNQEQPLFEKLDIFQKYATILPPPLDFELSMEYVLYKGVCIKGFQIHTTIEGGQQEIDICNFANAIIGSNKLGKHFNLGATAIFGIYTNMTDENEFDYTIGCIEQSCIKSAKALVSHVITTSPYAKFTLHRTDRIKEAWHYIYGNWFPNNDEYRAPGFDFEIYYPESVTIYIPMHTMP